MMKKCFALLLTLALMLSSLSLALADDPADVPGTVDMPTAGIRFVPPEGYQNTSGCVLTDGAIELSQGIMYAYWLYCAMPEDEVNTLMVSGQALSSVPVIDLFYVFSIGADMTFDNLNAMLSSPLDTKYVQQIGKVGDVTYYLYMEDPNPDFAASLDAPYKDEYNALAAMKSEAAAAFTCFERVSMYDSIIGSRIDFTTTDLDGKTVSAADLFAQNEITMINVWATWCGPCVGELGELQQIHTRLQDKNCGIIGILVDRDLDSARRLVKDNGITYPVILSPDIMDTILPSSAIPTSYFVDRNGIVLGEPIVGAMVSGYESRIDSLLKK